MKAIFTVCMLLVYTMAMGQFGGVQLNTESAQESYTLYTDRNNTYLIDNCGGVVKIWPFGRNDIHLHPKLLENGNLVFLRDGPTGEPNLVMYDWEGNLLLNITDSRNEVFPYYEVILLENGNFLTVGREYLSEQEFIDIGYDVDYVPQTSSSSVNPIVMDMILEMDTEGNIVWEWHLKDHVIQDRSATAANFGDVSANPQLLDMGVPVESIDWNGFETFMINSFDYNPALDQIVISIRKMGEIAIIDHSTTTEEAAGHTGGNQGKGGDILWRWGRPSNYGVDQERFLYYQHNPNWIEQGPYKGMLTCFNNGLGRPGNFDDRYSQVPVIDTEVRADGSYALVNGTYSPEGLQLVYDINETNTFFYSSYTSGAEFLPNGNIHITVGQEGRMFEINPEGEVVWDYIIENSGYIYRSEKYPLDYPAFVGRDMTPTSTIASVYDCSLFTEVIDLQDGTSINYLIKPDHIEVSSEMPIRYSITDAFGRVIIDHSTLSKYAEVSTTMLTRGVYFLTFANQNAKPITVKFIK